MTNHALTIGQLIANAYPADTRLLFQKYGITVPPTGKTILDASLVHGQPFIADLYTIARQSTANFSAVVDTGLETDKVLARGEAAKNAATAAQENEKNFWQKFASIFNKAGNTVTKVSGVFEALSVLFGNGTAIDTGNGTLSDEMYKIQLDAQKEAEANQTKTYLLIGAGILVAVLVVIMYLKRK